MLSKYSQVIIFSLFWTIKTFATASFMPETPRLVHAQYNINGPDLCATAQQTLAYLNKGANYDPLVIHPGKVAPIELSRIKDTLQFICQYQNKLNDPGFIKAHFEFIRWRPDMAQVKRFSKNKPLLKNLPNDHILMTKYYVHLAKASIKPTATTPYAIYALPKDEQTLTLEEAQKKPALIRFQYGKHAILSGALKHKKVPILAYVSRDDLEAALMQGTLVADFGGKVGKKTFNVHRNNNVEYDRLKTPLQQERYWYFKQVDGIKGYGKDADHKITVNPGTTFAADLTQLGLGKLLLIQYPEISGKMITRAGILADTGGAFANNLYQVDYLTGVYQGKSAYIAATRHLPSDVIAYFMVLKKSH